MNERIRELAVEATKYSNTLMIDYLDLSDEDYKEKYNQEYNKKFAELIVKKTLDEVKERAYYSGDRAWSDETDRQWIELEFGIGPLADAQRKTGIK